ncbi:MAG: MerR family transcriptional regulator [Gemmatimonadales bacterium]|nr:MerR family transcriptional regulator [Gemmatimonadales bacterium]
MPLTIGQVAKAADVNIETIRYYERRGLFPSPRRTAAGYRQYEGDAVRRLKFVKRAQDLSFTLKEIEELLALRVHHGEACDAVERQVRQKIIRVERMLNELSRVRDVLGRLADACESGSPTGECPILEVLDDDGVASR